MLVERGVVTFVDSRNISVNCRSKIDCVRCAEGKGCGGGILARWLGNRQYSVNAFYDSLNQTPKVGDFVSIGVPANHIVKLAAIMYGTPLLMMILFLAIQVSFFPELYELYVIALSIIAMVLGFKIASSLVERANKQGLMLPRLIAPDANIKLAPSICQNRIEST